MAAMLRAKQKRQAQLQAEQADACVVDLKGHCHLPNIQSNHVVPSNRLLGRVYRRKLHEVVCRKDMFRIWNALGTSIASTMLQGKGVRFDGVLDLTPGVDVALSARVSPDQTENTPVTIPKGFEWPWKRGEPGRKPAGDPSE